MSTLLAESGAALLGLGAVIAISTGVVLERREARRTEARSAALEVAQNQCDRLRRGQPVNLPPGWTIERTPAAPGVALVRIGGEGVSLTTLVATP